MRYSTFRTFKSFIDSKKLEVLEFGCSDGQMTEMIANCVKSIDVVDGSIRFIQKAKERNISNANYYHSLFEEFRPTKKYDAIFATYVLTHIPDLALFFSVIRQCLKADGVLFIAVPNSRVLSRQLAVHMGLLKDLFFLSENDINHGHCRCYDRVRLNRDIEQNGFYSIAQGGIILKPLADFQMDKLIELDILKGEQMEGIYKLGLEYPDLSAAIFSICKAQ